VNDLHDLETVIRSRFPLITVETLEERRVLELLRSACQRNDWPLLQWDSVDGLVRGDRFNEAVAATQDPDALLRHLLKDPQNGVFALLDFEGYLVGEPTRQRAFKRIVQAHETRGRTLVMVGHRVELEPDLKRLSASFVLSVPDVGRVRGLLNEEVNAWRRKNDGPVTGSLEAAEMLVRHLVGLCEEDVRRLIRQSLRDDSSICMDDVARVQKVKYDMLEGADLLALEMDVGSLEDIGGFGALKRWLKVRRKAFLDGGERLGLPTPRGVLLLGVQGAGKSLAARCVAGAWGVPLLRMDFGVLFNKYFGETERNTRAALTAADRMSPCVLWMDEIEKGLSSSGNSMDGGVSRRVLGTLLTWMAERDSRVFLVATANDIAALPPELMRKGRFDEIFFADLPDAAAREQILRIHLSRRELDPGDFDLPALIDATTGFSGAEIEQAIVASLYEAHADGRRLTDAHLLEELARTRPLSVVMAEKVEQLRAWAADRAVSAD
jgi:SpoVK/Ycf46/Vps4 family AAA+-type ATPase